MQAFGACVALWWACKIYACVVSVCTSVWQRCMLLIDYTRVAVVAVPLCTDNRHPRLDSKAPHERLLCLYLLSGLHPTA